MYRFFTIGRVPMLVCKCQKFNIATGSCKCSTQPKGRRTLLSRFVRGGGLVVAIAMLANPHHNLASGRLRRNEKPCSMHPLVHREHTQARRIPLQNAIGTWPNQWYLRNAP